MIEIKGVVEYLVKQIVDKPEEVEVVIKKGLDTKGPVIMEFVVEREEGVYPMVPAGASITDMLLV